MIFFGIFLSHSTKKSLKGTLQCFRNFLVLEKFMDKRCGWSVTSFRQKYFGHRAEKNRT